MPIPVSVILMVAASSSRTCSSETLPSGREYLTAFANRFVTICVSLVRSPWTYIGASGFSARISTLDSVAIALTAWMAPSDAWRKSTRSILTGIFPRVILVRSSRSSSSDAICALWRSIMSWQTPRVASSVFSLCSSAAALRTALSGFLSSCESIARVTRLNDVLADLRRKLRKQVTGPARRDMNCLQTDDAVVRSGFVVRYFMRDDSDRPIFGLPE